jgi:flagellar hook-basal body complex protein FliE
MDIKDVTRFPGLVPGIGTLEGGTKATSGAAEDGKPGTFAAAHKDSIAEVNSMQQKADAAITALATGDNKVSLHETMIAMEQADVSFRLMMQVRNKIVEAYQEILRMQV